MIEGPQAAFLLRRALSLGLALVVLAALIVAMAPRTPAATGFSIEFTPAIEGNRAVKAHQAANVSGTAPAGRLQAARVVAYGFDGQVVTSEAISSSVLNRGPSGPSEEPRNYLQNDNGTLSGRITLVGCHFAARVPGCNFPPVGSAALEINVEGAGWSPPDASNRLRVDYTNPIVRGYELIAPNRIVVVFSEPVRHKGGDVGLDWRVTEPSRNVIAVEGPRENDCVGRYLPGEDSTAGPTGCTRTLVLDLPVGEDDKPFVEYVLATSVARHTHDDYASNITFRVTAGVNSNALNRVRPALPSIQTIGGRTPSSGSSPQVIRNQREPVVRVGNVLAGHKIFIAGYEDHAVVADRDAPVEIKLPNLGPDGDYVFTAVAEDPHGNRSDETGKSAARADGSPNRVTYVLDTVKPRVASALRTATRRVEVTFTKDVLPAGHAGEWKVEGQDARAEGEGRTRILTVSEDLPEEPSVSWSPTEGGGPLLGEPGEYEDRAGNLLDKFGPGDIPVDPLPPLDSIVVLQPKGELYTSNRAVQISGSAPVAEAPLTVELYDEVGGQRAPQPRATTTSADGTWGFDVALPADARYSFQVRAVDPARGPQSPVPVPDIVLDTLAPFVTVTRPAANPQGVLSDADPRPRFGVGGAATIEWFAKDVAPTTLGDTLNPDHGDKVELAIRLEGDAQPRAIGTAPHRPDEQQAQFTYTIKPEDLAGQGTRQATFDVTVIDLAGNKTTASSFPIVIDGSLLDYTPVFVQNDPNQSVVEVRFPAPVVGTTTAAEWRIDGTPARTAALSSDGRTLRLFATQSITDPNATPVVQFQPLAANTDRLRGADGKRLTDQPRTSRDGIPPVLQIGLPDPGPRSARSVAVTGRTDQTQWPNTVRAYRVDAAGQLGAVAGQATAGNDGRFTLTVPLEPDRLNRIAVQAVDPGANTSPGRLFEVIEDSTPPVVTVTSPLPNSNVRRNLAIRWETKDNNPDVVSLDYRVNNGSWQPLAKGRPDDGAFDWRVPDAVGEDDILGIRITATDRAGHVGPATVVPGLSLRAQSLLGPCENVGPAPFVDRSAVPTVHREAVDCLYALGIAQGRIIDGQRHFLPQHDISRGQFSGFLFRTLDHAEIQLPGPASRFDDVRAGHTFDEDIHRLAAAEVILGYDERRFGPADSIKRDQTASLLLRALGYSRAEVIRARSNGYFADTAGSVHRSNIDAAYEQKLVLGRTAPTASTPGVYDPASRTTRAQMATVLYRALGQFD